MDNFFAMGGYGAFIWPAYGAAAVLMMGLLVLSWKSMRQREALVETLRASRRKEQTEVTETVS
ncbi:MAG: heme exporter protein CcmD [Proteobacteria bacterium]|nr:heme exporter protein CcmD [Pseudomonadota bacterium]MCK4868043.1 heme exporter protein CcmD [Alphaproteobacteria bacterium]